MEHKSQTETRDSKMQVCGTHGIQSTPFVLSQVEIFDFSYAAIKSLLHRFGLID